METSNNAYRIYGRRLYLYTSHKYMALLKFGPMSIWSDKYSFEHINCVRGWSCAAQNAAALHKPLTKFTYVFNKVLSMSITLMVIFDWTKPWNTYPIFSVSGLWLCCHLFIIACGWGGSRCHRTRPDPCGSCRTPWPCTWNWVRRFSRKNLAKVF